MGETMHFKSGTYINHDKFQPRHTNHPVFTWTIQELACSVHCQGKVRFVQEFSWAKYCVKTTQRCLLRPWNVSNRQIIGASPRTPLGEIAALPRPSSWLGREHALPKNSTLLGLKASIFGPEGLRLWPYEPRVQEWRSWKLATLFQHLHNKFPHAGTVRVMLLLPFS